MKTYKRSTFWWGSLCALLLCLWATPQAMAKPRKDLDGKRIGAQELSLGQARKDTLEPPSDAADWSYIKVEDSGALEVSVKLVGEGRCTVTLIDASGKVLVQKDDARGAVVLSERVKPGIFYVEVTSQEKLGYSIEASLK